MKTTSDPAELARLEKFVNQAESIAGLVNARMRDGSSITGLVQGVRGGPRPGPQGGAVHGWQIHIVNAGADVWLDAYDLATVDAA
jgi:hypothetical protein